MTAVEAGHSGEDGLDPLNTPSALALLNHTQEVTAHTPTHTDTYSAYTYRICTNRPHLSCNNEASFFKIIPYYGTQQLYAEDEMLRSIIKNRSLCILDLAVKCKPIKRQENLLIFHSGKLCILTFLWFYDQEFG